MKLTRLALLFFCLLWPLATSAADSASNPVPAHWLHLTNKNVVLDIRHEKLATAARTEAGELVQSVIKELLYAGCTIHFSRAFVESEVAYYQKHLPNEHSPAIAEGVLTNLATALKDGEFNWENLRDLHRAAPDFVVVTRHLPWLAAVVDPQRLRLAGVDHKLPVLELAIRWNGLSASGSAVSGAFDRRGFRVQADTRVSFGKAARWNINSDLRLHRDGAVVFEKNYPAEPWKKLYGSVWDTPLYVNQQKILADLKTGLKAPPPPPTKSKAKKKAA